MILNEPTLIHWVDVDLIIRLAAAAALGLLLGLDRELRGHAAGLRTHGIICFASAAMTVSALALYFQLDGQRMDPLRIFEAAGAFLGIVGAGLVILSKGKLKNVTTAAYLWLTAMIGIACGAGQWPLVAAATVIGLVLLTVIGFVEDRFIPPR
ncbi:putative Mg2+ transporter-C (MgtC) family protein [Altererythrobacter atlanticus]|uniref:Protein MgtC n=1 Tax=Croceibacterium atlanticum TaxID=1267766 RepID=A0A0F7KUH4_9SPHN|nr:MgtC/SapB family protein [Croceibacterium atlanticum]AKH43998.1 putative Mg(2+) transport ATPase [Croceibacterium atlanticum]MBB5732304.1 putative Mg2+ transporter-C (MgtC) family protein [Croceibacterium atlanticum]